MLKKSLIGAVALVSGVTFADGAFAGGYLLNEFSAVGQGRAFAGAGVVGDDYSAIAFNPAGMTLKGSGLQLGGTLVELRSHADGALSTGYDKEPGKVKLFKTLPNFFGQYKYNDQIYFGLGAYMPFGLATKYNWNWYGATHGVKTELTVLDIAGAVAVKPTEKLSVGAAIIARYVYGNLTNQVGIAGLFPNGIPGSRNEFELDGWDYGFNVGVMYEFTENLRAGIAYKAQSSQTVTGTQTISGVPVPGVNGEYDAVSTMTLPNTLTLSGFWRINDKFGLSGLIRHTQWDVFDDFIMVSDYMKTDIPEKWKNSWTFAAGLDYYLNENWTLRGGLAFDECPVRNSSYRTARIPDSDRYIVTFGFSYKYKNFGIDVGYSHIFMAKSDADNVDTRTGTAIHARYDGRGNMLGIQLQYDF